MSKDQEVRVDYITSQIGTFTTNVNNIKNQNLKNEQKKK